MRRHEYVLDLHAQTGPAGATGVAVRLPTPADAEALAELMLDAYLDTIDYEGESLEDARVEVAGYLEGSPLLECSWLANADHRPVSASS